MASVQDIARPSLQAVVNALSSPSRARVAATASAKPSIQYAGSVRPVRSRSTSAAPHKRAARSRWPRLARARANTSRLHAMGGVSSSSQVGVPPSPALRLSQVRMPFFGFCGVAGMPRGTALAGCAVLRGLFEVPCRSGVIALGSADDAQCSQRRAQFERRTQAGRCLKGLSRTSLCLSEASLFYQTMGHHPQRPYRECLNSQLSRHHQSRLQVLAPAAGVTEQDGHQSQREVTLGRQAPDLRRAGGGPRQQGGKPTLRFD